MYLLRCLLIGVLALHTWAAVAQMGINGRLDDWAEIPVLYAHDQDYGADSPLGRVARLKAAADEQQLFALIEFEAPRPFQDPARPERLRSGVWDDMTYLELDTNGDAKWDYRTQMSAGKRIGMNNLAVLQADPEGHARGRFLYPEGHKNYFPLGPRAWFSPDARAVEMRLPRAALALESGLTIGLRVHLRYRDTVRGSGAWVTEYYPPSGQWVPFTFGPPLPRGSRAVLTEGKVMLPLSITPEGVEVADANLMDNEDVAARPLAQPWKVPSLVENAQTLPMRKANSTREAEVESRAAYGDRVDAPRTPAGAAIQPLPSDATAFAMAPPADDPAAIPPDEQRPRSIPLAAEPTATPSPVPTLTPTPTTTATPTVTPHPTITVTPNPEPTATPWPTPTITPDPNPTPTPTPTPNPTMSPTPTPRPIEPQARQLSGPADAPLGQEPVVVDGNVQDWRRADFTNAISPQLMAQASASVAKLERISVATSPGYLYVRLDYVEPRRPGRNGAAGAEVLEQAGSLLRLDVDNNGEPDYEVRLTGSDGTPQGAELVNRADTRLLTPVADASQPGMALALSPDGKSVEIRLPRAALGLSGPGKVRLQAVARYQLASTGKWHHMAYPGPHSWFACALR